MGKIPTGDWAALWKQIYLCCARNIPLEVQDECQRVLEDAGWDTAFQVMRGVNNIDRVPSNVLGFINRLVTEEKRRRYLRGAEEKSGKSKDLADTPQYDTREVTVAMGDFLGVLFDAARMRIVRLQISAVGKPYPNIQDWYRDGCQPTWSEYHDKFLMGYYKAWRREQELGDVTAVSTYVRACTNKLREHIRARREGAQGQHQQTKQEAKA